MPSLPEAQTFDNLIDLARRIKSRLHHPVISASDKPDDPACTSKSPFLQDVPVLKKYNITDVKAITEEDTLKIHQNHKDIFGELGRCMSSCSSSSSSFTFKLCSSEASEVNEDASSLHGSFRLGKEHDSPFSSGRDSSSTSPFHEDLIGKVEETVEDSGFHCDGGNESGRCGGEKRVLTGSLMAGNDSPDDDSQQPPASSPKVLKGRVFPFRPTILSLYHVS